MCIETDEFLDALANADPAEARRLLDDYSQELPEILSVQKGYSMARAILDSISRSEQPERPVLLAATPNDDLPWSVTSAFLNKLEVTSFDQISHSPHVRASGTEVLLEDVPTLGDMTTVEMTYDSAHISLPAVRIHFLV